MEMQELIARAERNIKTALGDNGIHQLFQYEFGRTQYENYKGNNLKRF